MKKTEQKEPKHKGKFSSLSTGYKVLIIIGILVAILVCWKVYQMGGFDDVNNILNPNSAPEIVYVYPGTEVYNSQLGSTTPIVTISELRAGIIDKDGDNLMVSFWVKHGSYPWDGIALFEGHNGTYVYKLPHVYTVPELVSGNYTWRIDVFDGKVTTSKTYPMYVV